MFPYLHDILFARLDMKTCQGGYMTKWQHVYNLQDSLYNICANICLHDNMSTICMTDYIITVPNICLQYMTTCLQSAYQPIWQLCQHMSTWQHVYMKTCLHDNMSTWTHVYVTTCLHDIMSTWQYVYMTTCLHDNMSTWQHVQIIEINIVQCEYNSYTLLYTLEAINLYI